MVDKNRKIVKLVVIVAALVIALLIIKPFFAALAFAAVFAFLLQPFHVKLKRKIPENVSAALITALVTIIAILLVAWGINFLLSEFSQAYIGLSKLKLEFSKDFLGGAINDFIRYAIAKSTVYFSALVVKVPQMLLSFFIFVMSLFYFLKDGKKIWKWFSTNIPLAERDKKRVLDELKNYAHAFIYVWLLIALIQGLVAAFGFYLFGVGYWSIAGLAAAMLSLIPILGPYLIYIPTGVYLILLGAIGEGIGLMTYGLVLGSILDYVIRPYFTGKWAAVHPLIVLIGIFGGLILLGVAGILVGPLLLLIAIAFVKGTSFDFKLK